MSGGEEIKKKYPKVRYIQHALDKKEEGGYSVIYGQLANPKIRCWISACDIAVQKRKEGFSALAYAIGTAVQGCPEYLVIYRKRK